MRNATSPISANLRSGSVRRDDVTSRNGPWPRDILVARAMMFYGGPLPMFYLAAGACARPASRLRLLAPVAVLTLAQMLMTSSALAQYHYWQGDGNSNWFDPASWNLGNMPDGFGSTVIDGKASLWGDAGDVGKLIVGDTADGALFVDVNGVLVSNGSVIGGNTFAGTMTVLGRWTDVGITQIGDYGASSLTVEGGVFDGQEVRIGTDIASWMNHYVFLTNGGEWTNSARLLIGDQSHGSFSLLNSSTALSKSSVTLGYESDGNGSAYVGDGSTWTIDGDGFSALTVGSNGKGELTVAADGTVHAERNSYVGYGADSEGTVWVGGSSALLQVDGLLTVGWSGTGTMTVIGGGVVKSQSAMVGEFLGSTGTVTLSGNGLWQNTGTVTLGGGNQWLAHDAKGTLNIGAATNAVAEAAGRLEASEVVFGAFAGTKGTLVFNHTETAYDFDTAMRTGAGQGTIRQMAGTTILSADNSAFLGNTIISGGTLRVGNVLGGTVDVSGGILGGTGRLAGSVGVGNGGTLAPGNSIGTLRVDGNVNFTSGSTFAVEINDLGDSDKLDVGGAVSVASGATLNVLAGSGDYKALDSYRVISAAGGISGKFGVTSDLYLLRPILVQSGIELTLRLVEQAEISSLARSGNQGAAADAIMRLGAGHPAYDAFLSLDEESALLLLSSMTGDVHAGGQFLTDQTYLQFGTAMGNRQADTRSGGGSPAMGYVATTRPSAASDAIANAVPALDASTLAYWLAPVGSVGRIDNDGSGNAVDWASGGLTLGMDSVLRVGNADVVAGVALGYLRSSSDGRFSNVSAHSGQVGVYGHWQAGQTRVSGTLSYGLSRAETERTITDGVMVRTATSNAWTQTLGGSVEISHALALAANTSLEPYLRLDGTMSHRGASSESGADGFNLDIASSSWGSLAPTLGLDVEHKAATSAGVLTTRAGAGWQHGLLDAPDQALRFAGTDVSYTLDGHELARDRLLVDLSAALEIGAGMSVFGEYAGTFSTDAREHGVRVGLGGAF